MEKLLTLGIDPMAIVVYMANTGLVLFVLTKLLYKPVLAILDKRRELIKNSMEEAAGLQKAFEDKLADVETQKNATEAELKEEIANLHKYTEQKRAELQTEMDQARTEMMRKAQEEVDAKKAGLIKEVEDQVKVLMGRIILDIVENKVPEKVIEESISSSWKQYYK